MIVGTQHHPYLPDTMHIYSSVANTIVPRMDGVENQAWKSNYRLDVGNTPEHFGVVRRIHFRLMPTAELDLGLTPRPFTDGLSCWLGR
jgi:hypothetical protein